MNFSVGDLVRINKCEECPAVVGKIAKISGFTTTAGVVLLNFGRGRPRLGQPKSMNTNDLTVVEREGGASDENSSS